LKAGRFFLSEEGIEEAFKNANTGPSFPEGPPTERGSGVVTTLHKNRLEESWGNATLKPGGQRMKVTSLEGEAMGDLSEMGAIPPQGGVQDHTGNRCGTERGGAR